MFTVRRSSDQYKVDQPMPIITAADHRAAARRSRLIAPGAFLIVIGQGAVVRFQVDALGRAYEIARYTA